MKIIGFEGSWLPLDDQTPLQTTYRTPIVADRIPDSFLAELVAVDAITLFVDPIELDADWRLVLTHANSHHVSFLGTRLRPVETKSGVKLLVCGVKQEHWSAYATRVTQRCFDWVTRNSLSTKRETIMDVIHLGCLFGGSEELYNLWGLMVEPEKVAHVRDLYLAAQRRGVVNCIARQRKSDFDWHRARTKCYKQKWKETSRKLGEKKASATKVRQELLAMGGRYLRLRMQLKLHLAQAEEAIASGNSEALIRRDLLKQLIECARKDKV